MATFIREDVGNLFSGASNCNVSLGAALPAETLIVASCKSGGAIPPSVNKPADETATWTELFTDSVVFGDGRGGGTMRVWAIRTTVQWASGTVISTGLADSTATMRLGVTAWAGVSTAVLGKADRSTNERNTDTLTASLADGLLSAHDLVLNFWHAANNYPSLTPGGTAPASALNFGTWSSPGAMQLKASLINGPGTRTATLTTSYGTPRAVIIVGLKASNYPPNAPTLTTMASGSVYDRAQVNRARHEFSDPLSGDSQSAFDIRWRLVGATAWTTEYVVTPNQFYDFAAGSLVDGDYERQVRTYDSFGEVGPWSTSGFFTAATKPTGPTITAPTSGSFVDSAAVVTWSVPNQTLYEVRRVADNAGAPDPTVAYWTSGAVADATARALEVAFPINGQAEHVQLNVQYDGLWSGWTSVAVDVSYETPPMPSFTLSADASTGSLLVQINNPDPSTGQEPTAYNDVYVDDGDGEQRKVTGLSPNSSYRYWTPISGRDYAASIRVVAVAANGTTASS